MGFLLSAMQTGLLRFIVGSVHRLTLALFSSVCVVQTHECDNRHDRAHSTRATTKRQDGHINSGRVNGKSPRGIHLAGFEFGRGGAIRTRNRDASRAAVPTDLSFSRQTGRYLHSALAYTP